MGRARSLSWGDILFHASTRAIRDPVTNVILLIEDNPSDEGLTPLAFKNCGVANEVVRVHGRTRLVPVVMLTSSRRDGDVARSFDLGANAYVREPADLAELARAAKTSGFWGLAMHARPRGAAS